MIQAARTKIRGTIALLAWLDEQHVEIGTATQADLEHYIGIGRPGIANVIYQFVDWVRETGLNPGLQVDSVSTGSPAVTMSDADRWRHVERLLHDTTIRHYTRIGGLFMLLFAQPLTTICRMKTAQVGVRADGVFVTFDRTPVEMPEPWAASSRAHGPTGPSLLRQQEQPMALSRGHLGNHLGTESIRGQLSNAASSPKPQSTPPCSNSPPRSRTRYWPTCSGSPPPLLPDGRPSPRGPGDNTPPLDAKTISTPANNSCTRIACPPTRVGGRGVVGGVWDDRRPGRGDAPCFQSAE